MMTIGGITLDHDLEWEEELDQPVSAGAADRTIYGTLTTQAFPLYGGRLMTLVGDTNRGWQARDTVQALQALAANYPGMIHTANLNNTTYSVVFRNEDQPVVSFKKITPATEPDADFWYYGSIKLRIVA
jgi:hypothetical protein